jgi:hypothetical protein
LESTVIVTRDEWNRAYYGKEVRPADILVKRTVMNPQSADLKAALARAAAGKPSTDPIATPAPELRLASPRSILSAGLADTLHGMIGQDCGRAGSNGLEPYFFGESDFRFVDNLFQAGETGKGSGRWESRNFADRRSSRAGPPHSL